MTRPLQSLTHWGPFRAELRNDRLIAAHAIAQDPQPSSMLAAIPELVHSTSRITRPAIREGWLHDGPGPAKGRRGSDRFVEVDWETATDHVAAEIRRVRDTSDPQAIFAGSYGWGSAGAFNHARTHLKRLMAAAGGYTGQVDNYSFAAGSVLLRHVLGDITAVAGPMSDWTDIAENTDTLLLFGGLRLSNTQVATGGGVLRSPAQWLDRLSHRGARIVTVSPLRDDAPSGAEWVPIRPGSDTAMILAMAHTLLVEDRLDRDFLNCYVTGADRFLDSLADRTPDWAEALTGVPAATIVSLAHALTEGRSFVSAAWSLQRADHGEQPFWALVALAAMVGQIGLPGGGVAFGMGSIGGIGTPRRRLAVPRITAPPNPSGLDIPVARFGDALAQPGTEIRYDGRTMTLPHIRMILWAGGNPFHHHQDLRRLDAAWQTPDTIVVAESVWTATALRADIVLPATTFAERDDIGASSKDRFVMAMDRLVPPQGEARDDYDIFRDIARKLGVEETYSEGRDADGWLRFLYAQAAQADWPDYDTLRKIGLFEITAPDTPATLMAEFRADPDAAPLATPSGRIELWSQTIADMNLSRCGGMPQWRPPVEWLGAKLAEQFPLHLITNQPAHRLHSQMDTGPVAADARVGGLEPLRLSPNDAEFRGIETGDAVRLWNARGACRAGAIVDPDVRDGVVQMSTGAWYGASADLHCNPNVLTRDAGASDLSQGCGAQSTLVDVAKLGESSATDAEASLQHGPPDFVA